MVAPGPDVANLSLIHIFSAKLSGTLQSAHLAKEILQTDKIHIFDSKSASIGEALLVITAGEMLQGGQSLPEVLQQLERDRASAGAYFTIDVYKRQAAGGWKPQDGFPGRR